VCGERNTRKLVLSAVHDVVRYIEQQGEVRVGLLGLNKTPCPTDMYSAPCPDAAAPTRQ